MLLLYPLLSLGSLICFILVLIKLGKAKGALHVILGILSLGIYPYIWGWIQAKAQNLSKVMIVWTVCILGSMVIGGIVGASAVKQAMDAQQQSQAQPK